MIRSNFPKYRDSNSGEMVFTKFGAEDHVLAKLTSESTSNKIAMSALADVIKDHLLDIDNSFSWAAEFDSNKTILVIDVDNVSLLFNCKRKPENGIIKQSILIGESILI